MKRDYISLADQTPEEIHGLLALARELKRERAAAGGNAPILAGKTLGMLFQKPSLRTRVSFEMGMRHLGGHAIYLGPDEVGLGKRESVSDVARVLSRYVDAIMARVFDHAHVVDLARWASVPVINGLSDYSHPCQGLPDLLTIEEKIGHLRGVRLAYIGDGNNVLTSLLYGGALTGMHVVAATPADYAPADDVVRHASEVARSTGGSVEIVRAPEDAARDADVLYTDTWVSMGQEAEAQARREAFARYRIDGTLLALAGRGAGVMHDLPAYRGQEITDEVADGKQSWIFDQAENRLHAQKAILARLLA